MIARLQYQPELSPAIPHVFHGTMLAKDNCVGKNISNKSYENCNPAFDNDDFGRSRTCRLRTAICKRHDGLNKLRKRAANAGWRVLRIM